MQEVQLSDLVSFLRTKIVLILVLTFLSSLTSAIISLNLTEIYASDAILKITDISPASGGKTVSSGAQGLASLAGINLGGAVESSEKTPSYLIAKLKSRTFFKQLLTFEGILEGIVAGNSFDSKTGNIVYDENKYNAESKKWIRKISGSMKLIPSSQEAHKIFLKQLVADFDKKTGFITVIYEHPSPYFAQKMLKLMVKEVNRLQKNQDLIQYEKEMQYLLEQNASTNIVFLEKSISLAVMNLIQEQSLAKAKDDYLVEYIDEPHAPESRIFPRRTQIVLITAFLSFIILIFSFTYYHSYLNKHNS